MTKKHWTSKKLQKALDIMIHYKDSFTNYPKKAFHAKGFSERQNIL